MKPASDREPPERGAGGAPQAGRTRAKKIRRLLLEVALAGLVYAAISGYQERGLLERDIALPAFDLQLLDGTRVTSESLRGQTTVVHFWATWCGVCQREFGMLQDFADQLPPGVSLLTLVAEDESNRQEVVRFAQEHELRYPIALASPELIRDFRVRAFPTNYFIDSAGLIKSSTVGMSTAWALRARANCDGPF